VKRVGKKATAQRAARRASQQLSRQRRERRRRTTIVSVTAVVVLLLAALTGIGVWQASRPADVAIPSTVTMDGAGLPVGTGPVSVEIYLDFLCPACQQFDLASRQVLDGYVEDGTITLVYRPISILDEQTTTRFSTRSAAAAGCAADGGAADEFVAEMMVRQPPAGTPGLSDDQMIEIGAEVGLTTDEFGECVRDGTYRAWVRQSTDAAFERGVRGTPTVFVDGELLEPRTIPGLVQAIEAAGANGH
jgi:protein-disulfide isomerase